MASRNSMVHVDLIGQEVWWRLKGSPTLVAKHACPPHVPTDMPRHSHTLPRGRSHFSIHFKLLHTLGRLLTCWIGPSSLRHWGDGHVALNTSGQWLSDCDDMTNEPSQHLGKPHKCGGESQLLSLHLTNGSHIRCLHDTAFLRWDGWGWACHADIYVVPTVCASRGMHYVTSSTQFTLGTTPYPRFAGVNSHLPE